MMDSFSYCLLPALLFVHLVVPINSFELEQINTRKASSSQQVSSGNSLQSFQNPDLWHHPLQSSNRRRQGVSPTTGRKDKSQAGMPPTGTKQLSRLDDDATGLGSLSHGHQEQRPAGLQDGSEGVFMGFGIPFHDSDNHAPGSGRKHKEHKKHGRKDKNKHSKGRYTEPELSPLNKEVEVFGAIPSRHPVVEEEVPPMTTSSSSPSSNQVTATVSEEPLAMSSAAPQTQKPSETRVRPDGEVMPTLDMALFDWTDYEDLKPDVWPSPKKKDKRRSKNLSSGNVTIGMEAEAEPCDHHLDCLPGSCCDLRQHVCNPHNRGLNNKCYDDCMCEEGLRCYAKFHRNRRVTRRRGRCVDPEVANNEQGSFITV
ncbi:draxin-like [Erpetoichthys calabaricus]|uniref:Dorsal inhibitory axon guidance protein b n=1 Tax=Erpetoichthys calabaricus TaxID=27687 RepID=A0A8C4S1H8_ERPCA|nr:draxin-like [Erpetoichthys calabaricus]